MRGRPMQPPEGYQESTREEIEARNHTPIFIPPGCDLLGEVQVQNSHHICKPVIICQLRRNLTYQCFCGCGRTYAGPGVDAQHAINRWTLATFDPSKRIRE